MRKGSRIKEITRKVGQVPRTGTILDIRDNSVEIKWDDGHISIRDKEYLLPAEPAEPTKTS